LWIALIISRSYHILYLVLVLFVEVFKLIHRSSPMSIPTYVVPLFIFLRLSLLQKFILHFSQLLKRLLLLPLALTLCFHYTIYFLSKSQFLLLNRRFDLSKLVR